MIPAPHASRRASPAEILDPVAEPGGLEAAHQGVEVEGHHHRGGDPAGVGEASVVGLDVLHECLAEPVPGRRLGWSVGVTGRCGEGEQGLAEHRPVQRGDGEPAVALPLTVIGHRERRRCPGSFFFGLEPAGLLGLGGLGVDDLEQPTAQDPQRAGVVVGGLTEQERLGLLPDRVVDLVRQPVDRVDDHAGLLDVDRRVRQRCIHCRVGVVEPRCEPGGTVGGRSRGPRLVGQPVRRRRRPHRLTDLDPLRVGQQPQLQLRCLRRQRRRLQQRGLGVSRRQPPHRRVGQVRQRRAQADDRGHHRVPRLVDLRCHDPHSTTAHRHPAGPVDRRQGPRIVDGKWPRYVTSRVRPVSSWGHHDNPGGDMTNNARVPATEISGVYGGAAEDRDAKDDRPGAGVGRGHVAPPQDLQGPDGDRPQVREVAPGRARPRDVRRDGRGCPHRLQLLPRFQLFHGRTTAASTSARRARSHGGDTRRCSPSASDERWSTPRR